MKTIEMKKVWIIALLAFAACKNDTKSNDKTTTEVPKVSTHQTFEQVDIEPILENDSLSIRAIEVIVIYKMFCYFFKAPMLIIKDNCYFMFF